jgi:hypothetical protein
MSLLKSNISQHQLSLDPTLNEKYHQAKLSKFTSSEWHFLMAEKGIGAAGRNYIYRKVGEAMTGLPARPEFSTLATEHGLNYEREGLIKFGEQKGLDSMLVQRLIIDGERCGGTPDGLIVLSETEDGLSLNVQTVEIKCPISFDAYIRLWKCKTPEDLKNESKPYYWQLLSQLDICGALVGYFICYHPFFKSGQMNVIEFRKVDIVRNVKIGEKNDFKLMAERKAEAIQIFNDTYEELINS